MRIRVVFLGPDPRDPLQQAAQDYLSRAGRRFDAGLVALDAVARGKGFDDARVRDLERTRLLDKSEGTTRIALDPAGKLHASSTELAADLEKLLARGRGVSFLVGGATGLDSRLRDDADALWSLSRLTLAHRLAVLVLSEQIYRAAEIARGGPYNK